MIILFEPKSIAHFPRSTVSDIAWYFYSFPHLIPLATEMFLLSGSSLRDQNYHVERYKEIPSLLFTEHRRSTVWQLRLLTDRVQLKSSRFGLTFGPVYLPYRFSIAKCQI